MDSKSSLKKRTKDVLVELIIELQNKITELENELTIKDSNDKQNVETDRKNWASEYSETDESDESGSDSESESESDSDKEETSKAKKSITMSKKQTSKKHEETSKKQKETSKKQKDKIKKIDNDSDEDLFYEMGTPKTLANYKKWKQQDLLKKCKEMKLTIPKGYVKKEELIELLSS